MSNATIQHNWSDLKAKIASKWSKFSDSELDAFKDNLDRVSSQVQKTYGIAKEQAEKEFHDFKVSLENVKETVKAHVGPVVEAAKEVVKDTLKTTEPAKTSPNSPAVSPSLSLNHQTNAMASEGGPAPMKKSV